jgi:hypothetical protein
MVFAVTPGEVFDYVLKEERGESLPTVFKIRTLTRRERAKIEDSIGSIGMDGDDAGEFNAKVGTQHLLTLRFGLAGWERFTFADGTEAQFKTKPGPFVRHVPTNETLDHLPDRIVGELVEAINRGSTVSEDEEKN